MPETSQSTSLTLLDLARAHDEQAWRDLTDLYGPLVYHWARSGGFGPEDSADIIQEVFRSVLTSLVRFRKRNSSDRFQAWLWTITKNKMRDHRRVGQNKVIANGGSTAQQRLAYILDSAVDELDSVDFLPTSDFFEKLQKLKSEFQEVTWNAFWRVTVDELSAQCVADELGIGVASVYQAKSRVLRRMRSEFGTNVPID